MLEDSLDESEELDILMEEEEEGVSNNEWSYLIYGTFDLSALMSRESEALLIGDKDGRC